MSENGSRIKDIARLAGVSIGTVDRVLHKRGRVSQQSFEKVEAAMAQLQYKPNVLASSLRRSKAFNVRVLLPDSSGDEYWQKSKIGILREAKSWSHFGCQVELTEFNIDDHVAFYKLISQVINDKPDGLVLSPIHYKESLQALKENNNQLPVALFNANIAEIEPLCFVGQDLRKSGRVAAQLIFNSIEKGGSIAIIHADEDIADAPHLMEKENGFREYFEEVENRDKKIAFIRLSASQSLSELVNEFTLVLEKDNVKAVFVTTSKGTSIIGNVLKKSGKKDLVMVGYDILEENVNLLKDGTIRYLINQNPQLLGAMALSHVLNYLVHNRTTKNTELFPIDIVTSENVSSYVQFNNR